MIVHGALTNVTNFWLKKKKVNAQMNMMRLVNAVQVFYAVQVS